MYAVQIQWDQEWVTVRSDYPNRTEAEWAIAVWRQRNGSNGKDVGFRVAEIVEPCQHSWHKYGQTNGRVEYGCQNCGATRFE